jgi:hypothetical protein
MSVLCSVTTLAQGKAPYLDSIQKDELEADLYFLSSDSFKGRVAATPESLLAAEYIGSRFQRLGLKPAGAQGSYFQRFSLMSASLGEDNLLEITQGENASILLDPRQGYYPHRFSASGRIRASVVFVGFGISAPHHSYEDYVGDSYKGKIVLALDSEPGARDPESPFDGLVRSHYSGALQKTLTAQDKGAIGILFVSAGPSNFSAVARRYWPETPRSRPRYSLASWVEKVRIPAAQISPALAEILLRGTGRSLAELADAAETESGMTPIPVPGAEIELTTSVHRHVTVDRNVLGLIEGSDPAAKDEWIILCAHYDHVGVNAGGEVFNGADDDGSGTVALFEIAEAYALAVKNGRKPRRSILFAAWDAEESGLLGAWAYTETPPTPLAKTVAVLNMDMIGRNQEVPVNGGGRFRGLDPQTAESNKNAVNIVGDTYSAELYAEVEKANQAIRLELETGYDNNASNILRRSDHWPFLQRGVPSVMFWTGFHPDYHRVTDDPEKINYEKMEKIVRLVHQLTWNLAQQDGRPTMNAGRPTTDP